MNTVIYKIIGIVLLFLGESVAIYAEVAAARAVGTNASFWLIFSKMFAVMCVAGSFLVAGYMFGFRGFKDIWIVSVISIASIVIMEPFINYSVFHQLPSMGAAVGLILGILGLVAAVSF